MDTILTIALALIVSFGTVYITLKISREDFESILKRSNKAIRLVKLISKDISDDEYIDIISDKVLEGLGYVKIHYDGKDKEYLILSGVCYTEELLERMGIPVDDAREELIHELFLIAYDIMYEGR